MIILTKEKVKKTIERLPDNFTVDQIVEELVLLNKIDEGLKDIEKGKIFTTVFLTLGYLSHLRD